MHRWVHGAPGAAASVSWWGTPRRVSLPYGLPTQDAISGTRLPLGDVEQQIEQAVGDVFKTRERPIMEKLRRDVRKDCKAVGLKRPSRKAIQARVSAHSLRKIARARCESAPK